MINFFTRESTKKVKNYQLFFLSSFSVQFFKCHDCTCSFLKSDKVFCLRGNFNWMENGLKPFIFIPFNLNNCHWILVVVNSCCKHIWKGYWGSWSTCNYMHWTWNISTKRLPNWFKADANEIWFNRYRTSKHQTH